MFRDIVHQGYIWNLQFPRHFERGISISNPEGRFYQGDDISRVQCVSICFPFLEVAVPRLIQKSERGRKVCEEEKRAIFLHLWKALSMPWKRGWCSVDQPGVKRWGGVNVFLPPVGWKVLLYFMGQCRGWPISPGKSELMKLSPKFLICLSGVYWR